MRGSRAGRAEVIKSRDLADGSPQSKNTRDHEQSHKNPKVQVNMGIK